MFRPKKNKSKQMGRKPNEVNPGNTIQATSKLKETQTNLEKRANFLRKKADNQLVLAKQSNAAKKKDEALHHLKRKQILDKEIKTIESSILTLEEQVLRIEGGAAVSDVYEALKLANAVMDNVNKKVDVDKLGDLLGNLEELNSDQDEIHELLAMKGQDAIGDSNLLEEFEKLDADMIEDNAFDIPAVPNSLEEDNDMKLLNQLQRNDTMDLKEIEKLVAPKKPPKIKKPVAVKNDDDDELAALEGEMLA